MTKKDRVQIVITGFLILVFIGLVISVSRNVSSLERGAGSKKTFVFPSFTMLKFKYHPSRNKGTPFILDKAAGEISVINRDPFVFGSSPEMTVAGASALSLKGIIWNETSPTAVINDSVVAAGSVIGGFTIKEILIDRVVLVNEKTTLELKLTP